MQFVLGGLPTPPAATRALAATMADWRHEAAQAETVARNLGVAAVGLMSVARVLIVSGFKELPDAWSAPFLWRTALMWCVVLLVTIWNDPPLRFVDVLGTRDLIVLAIFRAAPAAVMLLPLAAFISEASGARTRVGPSTGALTVVTLVAAVAVLSSPEFVHYQRHASWEHFANAATPAPVAFPSLFRILSDGPTVPMTLTNWIAFGNGCLMLAAATVGLSALAYQVRRRRSIGAWLVALSPFVLIYVATVGLWSIARVFAQFSLTVLPFILAGYLARQTKRREANAESVVSA